MIITRSPLRISLGGGGTDLPSYYRDYSGFVIAAAIDRYVYVTLHHTFTGKLILKYSKMERPEHTDQIEHPIIREALRHVGLAGTPHLEITSMADIPAGTGLGSSGSFTTALLKALHAYQRNLVHPRDLAAEACHIELDRLGEPIGKQDQYIAAYGGLTCFRFMPNGQVEAEPLKLSERTRHDLEDGLLLFFTGISSSAGAVLGDQDTRTKQRDAAMMSNLHDIKEMGLKTRAALEEGDLRTFAAIMNEHWARKKERSKGMTNPEIDAWYELAMREGALGGKLIGAGGRGFLMFYTEDKRRLRHAMTSAGMTEVRFRFDFEGTKLVTQT
jgi:D-glycero-alpha-D-manno-heptose-7-phosphate kinase